MAKHSSGDPDETDVVTEITGTDDGQAEEATEVVETVKPSTEKPKLTKAGKAAKAAKPAAADSSAPVKHSFLNRLYTGTGGFDVIGKRKMWYAISGAIMAICLISMLPMVRGFTFGIDFEGGTKVSIPAPASSEVSTTAAAEVFNGALGFAPESVVEVGSGDSKTVQIRTETLDNDQTTDLTIALFDAFQPVGPDGQPSQQAISSSDVSPTWGGQITQKMLVALLVFVVLVSVYIAIRYERYMALAALATMFFDLIVTAGVYSLVGFEVTPATVIGLLTILGFSIYDTVIVFDKVEENTEGFEHTTRRTYAEQANLAVNQTFMRSINTSVISVLPILALMVIAVWLLGVGTLQDLALVQLVGVVVGTYSSIFVATPLLVSMLERTEKVRNHTRRVLKRRARADKAAGNAGAEVEDTDDQVEEKTVAAPVTAAAGAPSRPSRPTGKRAVRRS